MFGHLFLNLIDGNRIGPDAAGCNNHIPELGLAKAECFQRGFQSKEQGLVPTFGNVLEQDNHRAIKRRVRESQHFRSFWGAWRTIAGYEAIHMIRKGQAYGSAAGAKVGLVDRFILGLFAASN